MNIFSVFRRYAAQILILGMTWALMGAASAPKDWWINMANDYVSTVRDGLRRGIDPNAVNEKGMPALMQAVRDEAWKSFDLLLMQRKINVNVTNKMDETPLMYVAVVGQTQRAAQLIAKGAQVNRLGWTPLHYAASRGHVETVKLLLKHQAIVNAPGPDGTTPLMMAAYYGDEETVRTLLAAGADITARNLEKQNAADWARRRQHAALADKLDDLAKRVLDKREAQRGGAPAPASPAPAAAPRATGTAPAAQPAPNAGRSGQARQQTQQQTQKQPQQQTQRQTQQQPEAQESTSRYFDLQRFEREGEQW